VQCKKRRWKSSPKIPLCISYSLRMSLTLTLFLPLLNVSWKDTLTSALFSSFPIPPRSSHDAFFELAATPSCSAKKCESKYSSQTPFALPVACALPPFHPVFAFERRARKQQASLHYQLLFAQTLQLFLAAVFSADEDTLMQW
jgi:hypothetical protein